MRLLLITLAALAVMCSVPLASARVLDAVTLPSDITAEATSSAGASVHYDIDPSVTCSPPSDSTFPITTTSVGCNWTDGNGDPASGSFNVTVEDTTPPSIDPAPAGQTLEATSASGASATFSAPGANDTVDGSLSSACNPSSGSTFGLGTTTVTCSATDTAGNTSSPVSFTITVQDTTKPHFGSVGDVNVNTSDTGGADVSYSPPNASDDVSGSIPGNCSPAPGSHFSIGSTQVTCNASDAAGNAADAVSFNVVVTFVDTSGPTFSNVPGNITREANGPSGTVVTYTTPTAVDNVDGPRLVACAPLSGSTFPLGTTTVNCSASDTHGNQGNSSFTIRVVDTTPPNLIAPDGWNAYATTDAGIPINEGAASAFVQGAFVSDAVDPHPTVTTDAPALFPVGKTTVVFTARDASGNTRSATATLTVRPKPADGTTPEPLPPPPDRIPPDEVRNLAAAAGDGVVTLTWGRPSAADFAQVQVTRSLSTGGGDTVVYTGTATRFVDHGVQNGVEYRYVVVALDTAGNASGGIAANAKPIRSALRAPKDGAVIKKPPKLVWLAVADASYYNIQLFRGDTKILSAWPKKAALTLKKSWKYDGRTYKLTPGVYHWYVWAGFGARVDASYGDALGPSTFTVSR